MHVSTDCRNQPGSFTSNIHQRSFPYPPPRPLALTQKMATKVSTQPLQRLIKHRSVAPTRFFASASEAPHAPSSSAPTSSTSNPISYPPLATPTFDQAPTPYIAIPAAGLSPKQGTNRLRIFCHEGVASVAHTLAIVKAVEEKVGKVIDVHQRKVRKQKQSISTSTVNFVYLHYSFPQSI